MLELYETSTWEIKGQNMKGFICRSSQHDWSGTYFSVFSSYPIMFSVLFMNGKTALITTNYFNFIVYKEKIIYPEFIRVI